MNEVWKPIRGYEGLYEASNLGRIYGVKKDHILKSCLSSNEYLHLALSKKGKLRWFSVHVLVAKEFKGDPPTGMEVNHKDGCKTNNWDSNLEYITRSNNLKHAVKNGLWNLGEKHHNSKLTEDEVRNLQAEYAAGGFSQGALGIKYGISQTHVGTIVRREVWASV